MYRSTIFRSSACIALLALTTACGDSRLGKLSVGMSKDSVGAVMNAPTPHTSTSYLTGGRQWEIDYYTRNNEAPTDSVAWRKMSPVVLADGKVIGWGWKFWDRQAKRLSIPVPAAQ